MRVGLGYDLHRTQPGRMLVLGGVFVESDFGLVGHSDADVVLHAVTDALLGAAGLPDIGDLFPDNDPQYKDADSRLLLAGVMNRVVGSGFAPVNIDLVIHAERPKLGAIKRRIAESIAEACGMNASAVGVKAKTNEGVGAIGRGEAIACTCVVLLTDGDNRNGPVG